MMLAVAFLGLIGGSVAAAPVSADEKRPQHERVEGLVFVQTNKPLGNTIRVYERSGGGELTLAGEFETGGLGGSTLNPPVDPLASQSSLVYRDGLLFAVNAGSNTVTLFRVDGSDLERLQVIWSGGLLPVSLDVHDDLVYVLNAGGEGVVQGYRLDDDELHPIRGAQRSLGLDNPNPPPFGDAPAQVGIDPEGRVVLVSTKSHNIIDAFEIQRGGELSEESVSNPAEGMPFGFTFDHRGGVMVTQAATNAVIRYRLDDENGKLTAVGPAVPNGQMASCWIQRVGEFYYVANAGSSTISSYRIDGEGQVVLVAAVAAPGDGGTIDMTTGGGFLYVQNGAAGTVQGFEVLDDGSLKLVSTTSGLPPATNQGGILNGMEGIAATP
jgi:DNA-binding beta-propeller fold protein YncE